MKSINKILLSTFKYKKYNKSYSFGAKAILNNNKFIKVLKKCYCYLVCTKSGRLKMEQLESFIKKVNMGLRNKFLKKINKKFLINAVKIKANFFAVVSEKPVGLRMGKGKGSILSRVCPIRSGQILVIVKGNLNFFLFKSIFEKALKKLSSSHFKIIYRYKNV